MTRAVQVVVMCDFCEAPATPHTITLDDQPPRDLDVCDMHSKEAGLDDLVAALLARGRSTKAPTRKQRPHRATTPASERPAGLAANDHPARPCPWCPATSHELMRHARNVHGAAPASYPCPDCGRTFSVLQGVALHTQRAHGAYWSELVLAARANGDPHKVLPKYDRGASMASWPWTQEGP